MGEVSALDAIALELNEEHITARAKGTHSNCILCVLIDHLK